MVPKKPTELSPDQRKTIEGLEARILSIRGETLSHKQQRAFEWIEREDRKRLQDDVLEKFPRRDYLAIIGRSQKVLDSVAIRFKLPLIGETIDLVEVITAFHDILSNFGDRLDAETDDRDALECEKLRSQIAQMNHRTELLKLDFARENADSIERSEVRNRLKWLSTQLRQFGTSLGNRFGKDAQKLLNNFLERLEHETISGALNMEPPIE